MVNYTLVEYIKKYRSIYPVDKLKSYLVQQGYNEAEVNSAIKVAGGAESSKLKISLTTIFFVLTILVILVLGYYVFTLLTEKGPEISLSLKPSSLGSVEQGSQVFFTSVIDTKVDEEVRVTLVYELLDSSKKVQNTKTQTIDVVRSASISDSLLVPINLNPGDYTMRATINYEGYSQIKSFPVEVKKKKDLPPRIIPERNASLETCQGGCDDFNSCTKDECVKGQCISTNIAPCCGNNICETPLETNLNCVGDCKPKEEASKVEEIKTNAVTSASTNPKESLKKCLQIADAETADNCLFDSYRESPSIDFCRSISNLEKKDACINDYSIKKHDSSACKEIVDDLTRTACLRFV